MDLPSFKTVELTPATKMNNSSDFNYTPTFPGILKQALANGYNLLHATLEFTDNSISKHTSNLQVILEKTDVKPYLLNRITAVSYTHLTLPTKRIV